MLTESEQILIKVTFTLPLYVSQQEVKTVIQNLSNNKANLLGDIPSKF